MIENLEEALKPKYIFTEKEIELQNHIIENINDIAENCMWGEIERFKQQYAISKVNGRLIADIMIWHKDGTGTVIEVKRSSTNRNDILTAISQCLFYGTIMESALKVMPRLVIATPKIDTDTYNVIKRFNLPINLLMVDFNRCIYLGN
jgi:RecB family endonuclease NucS